MRIAFIENDSNYSQNIKELLKDQQWEIDFYENSIGFGKADIKKYNVVISEFNLEGINGKRLLNSISEKTQAELGLISELPKVWVLIDEAHQFIPSGKTTLSKEALIRWAKEGRQPGLSLAVASQQPSAIDSEVITQCDVLLVQKLTNSLDIQAVNSLSQDYMGSELKKFIKRLNRQGEAVLVDDELEKVMMIQIRPRKSHHGGGESAG